MIAAGPGENYGGGQVNAVFGHHLHDAVLVVLQRVGYDVNGVVKAEGAENNAVAFVRNDAEKAFEIGISSPTVVFDQYRGVGDGIELAVRTVEYHSRELDEVFTVLVYQLGAHAGERKD